MLDQGRQLYIYFIIGGGSPAKPACSTPELRAPAPAQRNPVYLSSSSFHLLTEREGYELDALALEEEFFVVVLCQ